MKNDLLTIGSFTVHGYGLMIAIGVIAAYMMAEYRAKKKNMDPDNVFLLVIWALVSGYIGSKLLFIITILPDVFKDPSILKNVWEGWVVYGGIIGGVIGRPATSEFAITFHNSAFAPNNIALVPTQIISSGLDFANAFVLLWLDRKKKCDGQIMALYLMFYSAGRFVLEYFRGDLERGSVGVLSTSQFISVFTFILGVVIFVARTRLCDKNK